MSGWIIRRSARIRWWTSLMVAMVVLLGSAFALIGGREPARFDVSSERPVVKFYWQGVPSIGGLEYYQDGRFLPEDVDLKVLVKAEKPYTYDDQELMKEVWLAILRNALKRWSEVEGSYLKFELVEEEYGATEGGETHTESNNETKQAAAAQDQEGDDDLPEEPDGIHLIRVVEDGLYMGAALPWLDEQDASLIIDCDIMIGGGGGDEPYGAGEYEYAITHELGHCLGLGHPHSSSHAVMSYHRSDHARWVSSEWELSVSDRAGIIYLYPEPGVLAGDTFYTCGSLGGYRVSRVNNMDPAATGRHGYHWWLWCLIPLGLCGVRRLFMGARELT